MGIHPVSKQTLQRLPSYLDYLKSLPRNETANISASAIAEALGLNDVQVRKDLASVSDGGRPKVGYMTEELVSHIETFLGYADTNSAVLVGAGNLGRALLSYEGFSSSGLDIVMAFDTDTSLIGGEINGKHVFPVSRLQELCRRTQIKLGIIAVPAAEAQTVCDELIEGGVLAIWNFASIHLNTPDGILVQDENMACSLALLSRHLTEQLYKGNSIEKVRV